MLNFILDETGFDNTNLPPSASKYALVFLVANEIRGVIVAVGMIDVLL